MLAANLANLGRIGVIYNKSIEQALVIFPALMAALITVGRRCAGRRGRQAGLQDRPQRPAALLGRASSRRRRSARPPTPRCATCRPTCTARPRRTIASVVRGARNYPCQEFPGKRAPTIQLCRDPKGYVPVGSNPWRGPPVPLRHADRRTAEHPAAQQVPVHPAAGATPIPGRRSVQLPPGVVPGPGPRPARAVPAAGAAERARAAAAPLPYYAPPDQVVPPYGGPPPPPYPPRQPPPPPPDAPCPGARGADAVGPAARRGGSAGQRPAHAPPTTRTASSSILPGELASSPPALTHWRPRRTGST